MVTMQCVIFTLLVPALIWGTLTEKKYTEFEYEYKVLERIVELEHDHKEMKKLVVRLQQLEDTNHETAKILESLTVEMRKLADDIKLQSGNLGKLHDQHASDVTKLEEDLKTIPRKNGGGSTYVRWGRTTCPANGTSLVYSGYVGGSYFSHPVSGGNYLCLPQNPDWDHYNDQLQDGALLYGGEYEFDYRSIPAFFPGTISTDDNAPCAVCTSARPRALMTPGKNRCPDGWTKEYHGYLVAERHNHAASSEFVCLDKRPEALSGGHNNQNGKLFFLVEGRCGSLKCPPYVNGRELTCVVCTK